MRLSQAFENTCEELLKVGPFPLHSHVSLCVAQEYKAFKAGLLTRLGYMSSLHEQEGGRNLNSTIVLDYVRQVMQICDLTVEEMTGSFNERVQQITFMSAAKQMEIYSAMGGRQVSGGEGGEHVELFFPLLLFGRSLASAFARICFRSSRGPASRSSCRQNRCFSARCLASRVPIS